ncbi:hypothetical protein [Carboxylicivirga sp. M1479]|uniref:hypothetical protein n=2 Tax=Carboxylicivirga TaxID=1628153 RepID=UPI001C8F3DDA|nr:hypothetical protein [Carboxylicivirga sp. M1479]
MVMLFAAQIASNALFYHTHTIDGKVYSHSHPSCDGHSHASADFAFYQQLQNILAEEKPKLLSDILPIYLEVISIDVKAQLSDCLLNNNAGRAPPVA